MNNCFFGGLATTPMVLWTILSASIISVVYSFHISLSLTRSKSRCERSPCRWPHVLATACRLDNFRAALSKYSWPNGTVNTWVNELTAIAQISTCSVCKRDYQNLFTIVWKHCNRKSIDTKCKDKIRTQGHFCALLCLLNISL